MELIPVTILSTNGTGNGLFGVLATKKDPRKDTRNPPGRTKGAGDTLLGHGSAHFYTGVPPVSSRALRECLPDRIRMRQAGGAEDAFGVHHRHLSLPPRAAALAPLRGYPMSRNERGENDEETTTKEETHNEENERRITERIGRGSASV